MVNEDEVYIKDLFKKLEESLRVEKTRFDYAYMDSILTPDFFEFGISGKIYSRNEVLSHDYQEILAKLPLENFKVYDVSDSV